MVGRSLVAFIHQHGDSQGRPVYEVIRPARVAECRLLTPLAWLGRDATVTDAIRTYRRHVKAAEAVSKFLDGAYHHASTGRPERRPTLLGHARCQAGPEKRPACPLRGVSASTRRSASRRMSGPRNEVAKAPRWWFGVAVNAVAKWRKSLGATRANNGGSNRLVRRARSPAVSAAHCTGPRIGLPTSPRPASAPSPPLAPAHPDGAGRRR